MGPFEGFIIPVMACPANAAFFSPTQSGSDIQSHKKHPMHVEGWGGSGDECSCMLMSVCNARVMSGVVLFRNTLYSAKQQRRPPVPVPSDLQQIVGQGVLWWTLTDEMSRMTSSTRLQATNQRCSCCWIIKAPAKAEARSVEKKRTLIMVGWLSCGDGLHYRTLSVQQIPKIMGYDVIPDDPLLPVTMSYPTVYCSATVT